MQIKKKKANVPSATTGQIGESIPSINKMGSASITGANKVKASPFQGVITENEMKAKAEAKPKGVDLIARAKMRQAIKKSPGVSAAEVEKPKETPEETVNKMTNLAPKRDEYVTRLKKRGK